MSNVRCWNCNMDFEVVGSARNINKPTAQQIEEVLRSNIFDTSRGTILVNIDDLIDKIAKTIASNI